MASTQPHPRVNPAFVVILNPANNVTACCVQAHFFISLYVGGCSMYAIDRRQLAAHIYGLLHSLRKTAILLQVSHTTVARWLKQPERKQYVRQSRKHNKVIESIKGCITSNPLITTNEVRTILKQVCNVTVSTELVRIAIRRLGFSRKRVRFYGDPPDLFAVTQTFLQKRQLFIDQKRRFVSIDETAFGRSCQSTHGYAPIGKRLQLFR